MKRIAVFSCSLCSLSDEDDDSTLDESVGTFGDGVRGFLLRREEDLRLEFDDRRAIGERDRDFRLSSFDLLFLEGFEEELLRSGERSEDELDLFLRLVLRTSSDRRLLQ